MTHSERLRLRLLFGMLGAVPVFLAGWLGWVQVAQGASLQRGEGRAPLMLRPDAADAQRDGREILPAPRGTIIDRLGNVLAIDREVYEVRAEVKLRLKLTDGALLDAALDQLAAKVAEALARGEAVDKRNEARERQQKLLLQRLRSAFLDVKVAELAEMTAPVRAARLAALPPEKREHNVLLGAKVESLDAIEALRQIGADKHENCSVWLYFQRGFARVYPDREVTAGIVGHEVAELMPLPQTKNLKGYVRRGAQGLESLGAVATGDAGERSYLKDASRNRYWDGAPEPAEAPKVLQSTIDLELQKFAVSELNREAHTAAAEGKIRFSDWGALVLVDIQSGDVLAMASFNADEKHAGDTAFSPTQMRYEPGSVVKPLVLAWALEKGGLDWRQEIDCTPTGERFGKTFDGRTIHDDHRCGSLDPHGIIINSSNIGAAQIGRAMERDLWHGYLDYYFHLNSEIERQNTQKGVHQLPFVRAFGNSEESTGYAASDFRSVVSDLQFRRNTAASLSIGYEMHVTAVQLARAYLSLLSGRQRNLRLCRGVEIDGVFHAAPPPAEGRPELSDDTREKLIAAMVDVVSEEEHATGSTVYKAMLKEEGIDIHGLIAGKTGTAVSTSFKGKGKSRVKVDVRNASFVAFAPANAPRYLAVGVLQKEGNARFYGGQMRLQSSACSCTLCAWKSGGNCARNHHRSV